MTITPKQNNQKGIIKLILILLVAIFLLNYFKIDLRAWITLILTKFEYYYLLLTK